MATTRKVWILAMVVMLGSLAVALGQTAPSADGDQSGGGGGGRGGRNYDPAQARQRMEERLKEALGATDDEFKALQPKIEHVMQVRRDASGFGGFGGRGPNGRRNGGGQGGDGGARGGQGGDANQTPSAVQQRTQELRELLDKKDAPAADIKSKLDALREAKTKAKDDLTKAQQELRDVLTQRQEATLVMWGMLD